MLLLSEVVEWTWHSRLLIIYKYKWATIKTAIGKNIISDIGSFNRGGRKPPFFYCVASPRIFKSQSSQCSLCDFVNFFKVAMCNFTTKNSQCSFFVVPRNYSLQCIGRLIHETRNMVVLAPILSHLLQNIRQIKMH